MIAWKCGPASRAAMLVALSASAVAGEVVRLGESNWAEYAPRGKEVDAIYGDYALRSDTIVAVVGDPVPTRNANVSILNIGGAIVDMTRLDEQNDQLYCYFPFGADIRGGFYRISGPVDWPDAMPRTPGSAALAFEAQAIAGLAERVDGVSITLGYELVDGEDFLRVLTLLKNESEDAAVVPIIDKTRADNEYVFYHDDRIPMWWCHDLYWRGSYGLVALNSHSRPHRVGEQLSGRNDYFTGESAGIEVPARGAFLLERLLIPGADTLAVHGVERKRRGEALAKLSLTITDGEHPVPGAYVEVTRGGEFIGKARADAGGTLDRRLPPGDYGLRVSAPAHDGWAERVDLAVGENAVAAVLSRPGYIEGQVTDGAGEAIPCKVAFHGIGVEDPDFGPDSAVHGVKNLWYTADGRFRVGLRPGEYEVLISHGPEFDAQLETVHVAAGETARVAARLVRSVDTRGWISADLHSHASESGDSTASQRGRVLNLLAEHVEFIPCTEHNRVCSYAPHLEHFRATGRALTCPGIELSGQPVLLNHQNAFPMIHRPHTQDGGGPAIHVNPEVQIERLAGWDDDSDKVVQLNHPDVPVIFGDADRDGLPDRGFPALLRLSDVMEVHTRTDGPAIDIFYEPGAADGEVPQVIRWMQLLNLGHRLPGVANTDAHRTFHGSGWLRSYIHCATDDPAEADLMEVCHAIERGAVVMTTGPFLRVEASSSGVVVGPGADLAAPEGVVELSIVVECPNWLDINRVQVFANGRRLSSHNFTRRRRGDLFGDGPTVFDATVSLALADDAHLVVAAVGEGLQLGRVVGPRHGLQAPIAVSNPIFVDVDGDGFEPNGDLLGCDLPDDGR